MQSVLLIDDDSLSLSALATLFEDLPCKVVLHTDPVSAIQQCGQETFELVFTDQRMPGMTGIDVLSNIRKLQPNCRRVIISAFSDFEEIIAGFNAGLVHRYLSKPWEAEAVKSNILQELKLAANYSKPDTTPPHAITVGRKSGLVNFNGLLTCNDKLQKTLDFIRNFASTEAPFCICGETGTGKELVARAIHLSGTRKNKPFIAMNCANLTETLLESQLFGHRKGAFTGAINDYQGLLVAADGGTLFLDEVVELPLQLQAKLLRVLQEKEFQPLGEVNPRKFDVQIISAAAISLSDAVQRQIFRADLRFRLDVMPVFLPPLRERREDISIIFDHYIRQEAARIGVTFKDVTGDVMQILEQYPWPGNVRELHNICIYMAAQLSHHDGHLNMDCVPHNILVNEMTVGTTSIERRKIERRKNPASPLATETTNQSNEEYINGKTLAEALLKFQGNKSAVARNLSISRMTLWRKLKQHNLQN